MVNPLTKHSSQLHLRFNININKFWLKHERGSAAGQLCHTGKYSNPTIPAFPASELLVIRTQPAFYQTVWMMLGTKTSLYQHTRA